MIPMNKAQPHGNTFFYMKTHYIYIYIYIYIIYKYNIAYIICYNYRKRKAMEG